MAGGQERVLRRRIKSVQSTKKITKAMELIAASRIAKAQQRVAAARPYSEQITKVIGNLARAGAGSDARLLQQPERVNTVCYVAVAGDRGLAGGYNSNIIRRTERAIDADLKAGRRTALVTVGKKATNYFRFRGFDIAAHFEGFLDTPSYENARQISSFVAEHFDAGDYDQVKLVYTRFLSVGSQIVTDVPYMPLDTGALGAEGEDRAESGDAGPGHPYEFEPSPEEILDRLLPRYAEARLYAALLEGAASFFAAQQRAMKSATDNAEDLITRLSRQMNRARQDSITTEIMEIVGGAEALRQGKSDSEDLLVDSAGGTTDIFRPTYDPSSKRASR